MKSKDTIQKKSRKRGRPCLLSFGREKKLFRGIQNGLPLKHAAQLAGLSYDTVNRWKIRGEDEKSPVQFCNFCNALKRAQAVSMNRLVGSVRKAGRKDWRAAAWLLERRHSEEFGKAVEVEQKEQFKSSLPSSIWDNHPVKQEIRKNEEIRELLMKVGLKAVQMHHQKKQREQWEEEDRLREQEERKVRQRKRLVKPS